MFDHPSIEFALGCLIFGFCAGFGWALAAWLVGRITIRAP